MFFGSTTLSIKGTSWCIPLSLTMILMFLRIIYVVVLCFMTALKKTIAKLVIITGNASNIKVKTKAICENPTMFIAVCTRHGSLMMNAVAKIDQQNIFFENMQLSTMFILFLEFVLLASHYSQLEYPLMSLLKTPS